MVHPQRAAAPGRREVAYGAGFPAASDDAMRLWDARAGTSLGGRWVGQCDAACLCRHVPISVISLLVGGTQYTIRVASSSSYRHGRESSDLTAGVCAADGHVAMQSMAGCLPLGVTSHRAGNRNYLTAFGGLGWRLGGGGGCDTRCSLRLAI